MSKKLLLVNRVLLISLVRERPAIWDKTLQIYKFKRAKAEAWRDICMVLNKDYEKMNQTRRNEYFKQIIRMWTYIRDSWMKSMKDKRNEKKMTKPYIYHEQLLFLKKIIGSSDVLETSINADDTSQEETEGEKNQEYADTSGFSMEIQEMIEDNCQEQLTKKTLLLNRSKLISLVRERPAIWDKTLDIYKNKNAKTDAWRDICLIMNENYHQLNQSEKREYFKLLISIWTQIRDTWMRSIKNKSSRPYKFHEKLLFLKKIVSSPIIEKYIDNVCDDEQNFVVEDESQISIISCTSTKRQKFNDQDPESVGSRMKDAPSQTENEDRNYSFFKSIQPTLAFFNDDQILQFQAGTINLLQKIRTGEYYKELRQQHTPTFRGSRLSEEGSTLLIQDPIKIESYEII